MGTPPSAASAVRLLRSIAAIVLATIVASLLVLSGALAHAALVSSDPADGSVLPTAPASIVFAFTEPVSPLVFTLLSADGERRPLDGAVAENQTLTVPLPPGLSHGTHLVSWRIVSADGHPVGGALVFSIGEPGTRPAMAGGGDQLLVGLIWLVRAALYAAMFLAVGTAVFGVLLAPLPRPLARLPLLVGAGGLFLAVLALGLHGLDALGVGLSSLLSATAWSAALSTSYGASIGVAVLAFLAVVLSSLLPSGRRRAMLVALAWISAALAPMLSGHAGTASPVWLSKPAVFLHIAGLVFWVGALAPLRWLLRSGDAAALSALQRFSRLIPLAVAPIIVSGIVLVVLQMGPPGPAWQSPYAILLGAKLALLLPLFGLALWNRVALTKPALMGAEPARRHLRRSIGVELLLVLLVFGVVAGWRFTPPPRVIAEIEASPARAHIHTEAAMADVTITPGHAGESQMRIWLTDGDFIALAPKSLVVALSSPALGIERLQRPATLGDDGYWQLSLLLPAGGTWSVELDVRIDDFKLVKLTGEIALAP